MTVLKAIVGSGHQQLKMADSESQPLDFRNIVMGISNYMARLDFMQMKVTHGPLHSGYTKSHILDYDRSIFGEN